jgi:hypothetical protein
MQKNPDFRFRRCGTSKNTKPMSKKKNTSQNTPKPTPPFTEEMVKARKMVLAGNSFREIADGWLGRTGKPVSRSHIWNIWTAADALESSSTALRMTAYGSCQPVAGMSSSSSAPAERFRATPPEP